MNINKNWLQRAAAAFLKATSNLCSQEIPCRVLKLKFITPVTTAHQRLLPISRGIQ
jgi:3-polyprenyl-4-hydroxybenzoate decarboxylase